MPKKKKSRGSNTFIAFLAVNKIEKILIMAPTTCTVIANKMCIDLKISMQTLIFGGASRTAVHTITQSLIV